MTTATSFPSPPRSPSLTKPLPHRDYARIERAIRFLVERSEEQPDLARAAAAAGLSPFHFDRLFQRWAGISPMRFARMVALTRGKQLLAQGRTVLDTALELGLSGPSRLHDLFVTVDAATPGEFQRRGRELRIAWGEHASPFGRCLIGLSERGVTWLSFVDGDARTALEELRASWPEAELARDDAATAAIVPRVFGPLPARGRPVRLHVRGTNFQAKVWAALLRLPEGAVTTYGDLARSIGEPRAARAVGAAVGANDVSVLIPCHRVIRESGHLGDYRWGPERKRALLAWEAARRPGADA